MFQSGSTAQSVAWKKKSKNAETETSEVLHPRHHTSSITTNCKSDFGIDVTMSGSGEWDDVSTIVLHDVKKDKKKDKKKAPLSPKRRASVDEDAKKGAEGDACGDSPGKRRASVDERKRQKFKDKLSAMKSKKQKKDSKEGKECKDTSKPMKVPDSPRGADKLSAQPLFPSPTPISVVVTPPKPQAGVTDSKDGSDEIELVDSEEEEEEVDWSSMVSGEFHSIEKETDKPYDFGVALKRENVRKNRYGNALANAETRVKLQNGEDSDYINANFIQGNGTTTYIAAQAPLTNTFCDFWLMVYEQKTRVIMMLTKLQEKDRTKADVYWPRKGPLSAARGPGKSGVEGGHDSRWKSYGTIGVLLEKTVEANEEITLRYFRLREEDSTSKEHTVVQIHYTGWPDFGVPDDTSVFRKLLELMEKHSHEPVVEGQDPLTFNGPIIIHCSAGLGRTGTLIAAHIASEQLASGTVKNKDEIDMKKIVKNLREQRAGMVQTSNQYQFLFALLKDL